MALAIVYEELKHTVTCSVCFEPFEGRNPKLLNCFHAFCCDCIQKCVDVRANAVGRTGEKILPCPICNFPTSVPRGDAVNLPAYFHGNAAQTALKQLDQRQHICDFCELASSKSDVCSYCLQCTSIICVTCKSKHDHVHPRHHQVSVTPETIVRLMCQQHNKHVGYYCVNCTKTICDRCRIKEHLNHQMLDIVYGQEEADDFADWIKTSVKSAEEKLERLIAVKTDFNLGIEKSQEELRCHYVKVISELKQQYEYFCVQLQEKRDIENVKFDTFEEQLRFVVDNMSKIPEIYNEPLKGITEAKLDKSPLLFDAKNMTLATDVQIDKPEVPIFNRSTERVTLGTMVKDSSGELDQCISKGSLSALLWTIEGPEIIDMSFLSDDMLITVGNKEGLRLYNKKGQLLDDALSGLYHGSDLCDVSVDRSGSVIVIAEDRGCEKPGYLHILTKLADEWQPQRHDICRQPIAVALTRNGEFIVNDSRMRMHRYDRRGKLLWNKTLPPSSHSMCVDQQDRILVCWKHNVSAFEGNGNDIATFSLNHDHLDLRGICINDEGQILVGDLYSQSVLLFDKDGRYVKHLVKVYGRPRRLALYGDKFLAVRLHDGSNKMSVYELECGLMTL